MEQPLISNIELALELMFLYAVIAISAAVTITYLIKRYLEEGMQKQKKQRQQQYLEK